MKASLLCLFYDPSLPTTAAQLPTCPIWPWIDQANVSTVYQHLDNALMNVVHLNHTLSRKLMPFNNYITFQYKIDWILNKYRASCEILFVFHLCSRSQTLALHHPNPLVFSPSVLTWSKASAAGAECVVSAEDLLPSHHYLLSQTGYITLPLTYVTLWFN